MTSGKRVVRPDRMIRWKGEIWRARHAAPDWVVPGTMVRVTANKYSSLLWVRTSTWNQQERFVRDCDWLPEGF